MRIKGKFTYRHVVGIPFIQGVEGDLVVKDRLYAGVLGYKLGRRIYLGAGESGVAEAYLGAGDEDLGAGEADL